MTVTYRSVAMGVFALLMLAGGILYILYPEQAKAKLVAGANWLGSFAGQQAETATNGDKAQQARFTALDGSVRVKKATSNSWANADYGLTLEKGDVVQTGSEGMARVRFGDGTDYTVKPDSLIVIEEHTTNAQQTQVSVQVTTGTVDLATSTLAPGSRSQVTIAGATASFGSDSTAMVRNDPRASQSEILVKQGSGEVTRGDETVKLGTFEKVAFKPDSKMLKSKELSPPTLISPSNMMPIFSAGNSTVDFSWTPVDSVDAYRVRISQNPFFSSLVLDRRVAATDLKVSDLKEGAYYWLVQALDGRGRESIESEKNRFTVITKGKQQGQLALSIDNMVQHGRVIEVRGKTEVGSRVMVNGQEVAIVRQDGSFSHFTGQLPDGENLITVTAQNAKGGVNTQTRKIVIYR